MPMYAAKGLPTGAPAPTCSKYTEYSTEKYNNYRSNDDDEEEEEYEEAIETWIRILPEGAKIFKLSTSNPTTCQQPTR